MNFVFEVTSCRRGRFHWRRYSILKHSAGEAPEGEETARFPPPHPPQNRLLFLKKKNETGNFWVREQQ